MSDTHGWEWFSFTNRYGEYWEGRHLASGLECMIHMSRKKKRGVATSTTFWIIGKRGSNGNPRSDRYLDDESFTNYEEAKRWIESNDPWWIYENRCRLPDHVESYNDPEPTPRGQRSFF